MFETKTLRWLWPDWIIASAATLLAGVLRFHALDRKPFWLDEGVSVAISRLDWYNFARLMWRREANMSLYYLLLRGWEHLGGSEFFIRSLSVIFAVATVPALYWLALRLFSRPVAIMASLLLAVNAYHIRYAQEARSYSLYVLLGTLSWIFFVEYIVAPSKRNWQGFVAFSALSVYAHLYFAFFIVAQWVSLHLLDRSSVPSRAMAAFRWIAAITFPAFLFAATTGVGPLRWVPRPRLGDIYSYFDHMAGNGGPALVLACMIAIVIAIWPVASGMIRRNSDWGTWPYQLLLIWILLPVGLILGLSLVRPMFVARYFIACQPAFVILVAVGLSRIPRAWLEALAVGLLIALSARGTLSYYDHDFDLDRGDYRSASRYVLNHAHAGDALLFDIAQARMPYEYYRSLHGAGEAPRVIYPSLGDKLDYRDFMGKAAPNSVRASLGQYDRLWVINASTPTRDPDPATQALSETLANEYPGMEEKTFSGVTVRLYSRPRRN